MMQLRPYQESGAHWLARRKVALLADEMRVGKTPTAIRAADMVGAKRVLVLCPAIAVDQWCAEWRRWSPDRAPAYRVTGPYTERIEGVTVSSYGMLHRVRRYPAYDLVILDEAHMLKSPDTARTTAVFKSDGVATKAGRVWALTGTPCPNHAGELWVLLRAFGAVNIGYKTFVQRYCDVVPGRGIVGTKKKMYRELNGLLRPVMLRRMRAEVAPDLPPIAYNLLHLGVNGPYPEADSNAEVRRLTAEAKAPALAESIALDLTARELERTVVFGYHVDALHTMARALYDKGMRAAVIEGATVNTARQAIIHQFQAGELDVVVAQILAAGTAIDLSAAQHGYFLELDWVPANNAQAAARLVSVAKGLPVSYDVAVWGGSIDEDVQRSLMSKTQSIKAIIEGVEPQ